MSSPRPVHRRDYQSRRRPFCSAEVFYARWESEARCADRYWAGPSRDAIVRTLVAGWHHGWPQEAMLASTQNLFSPPRGAISAPPEVDNTLSGVTRAWRHFWRSCGRFLMTSRRTFRRQVPPRPSGNAKLITRHIARETNEGRTGTDDIFGRDDEVLAFSA